MAAATLVVAFAGAGWLLAPGDPQPVVCADDPPPAADTVVMLAASWCPHCTRARRFFADRGVQYCEYDVDRSPTGAARYARAGTRMIPIIYVRDQRIVGFSADEITQALIAHGLAAFEMR